MPTPKVIEDYAVRMSTEDIGSVTVAFLKYNNLSVQRLEFLTSPIT